MWLIASWDRPKENRAQGNWLQVGTQTLTCRWEHLVASTRNQLQLEQKENLLEGFKDQSCWKTIYDMNGKTGGSCSGNRQKQTGDTGKSPHRTCCWGYHQWHGLVDITTRSLGPCCHTSGLLSLPPPPWVPYVFHLRAQGLNGRIWLNQSHCLPHFQKISAYRVHLHIMKQWNKGPNLP